MSEKRHCALYRDKRGTKTMRLRLGIKHRRKRSRWSAPRLRMHSIQSGFASSQTRE